MSGDRRDRLTAAMTRRGVLGAAASASVAGAAGCVFGGGETPTTRAEEECEGVEPSIETARNGAYTPLTRPLFTYVDRGALARPEVAGFARELADRSSTDLFSKGGFAPNTESEARTLREDLDAAIAEAGGPAPGEADEIAGQIRVAGATTMFDVVAEVARKFQRANPSVGVGIQGTGTPEGFRKFLCPGRAAFANASRPIDEAERALCRDNGVEPFEMRLARDPLTVVVNTDNDWTPCLTVPELGRIWGPDAVDTWSALDEEWPDEGIVRIGPPETSGTFEYFTETVTGERGAHTVDYAPTEQSEIVGTGVSNDRYAIGYLAFTFYDRKADKVRPVAIDPGP